MKISAPKSHPRYLSLYYRDLLSWGVEKGITSLQGLTSHGRGEAFDYLTGEKTCGFVHPSIQCAAAYLLTARSPVISVNGNTAILVPGYLIKLARLIPAKLEVNIFHKSKMREKNIAAYLKKKGAKEILLPDGAKIEGLRSNRRLISNEGQKKADVVFVPLEDGDRTERLISLGKKVITVDLNPLSRTAQKATVTIVDNIVRCLPVLINEVKILKKTSRFDLLKIIQNYNNRKQINNALLFIKHNLKSLAS